MTDTNIQIYKNFIKQELLNRNAVYLRGQFEKNGDIDFYVINTDLKNVENKLIKERFSPLRTTEHSISFFKYIFEEFIIIDIKISFIYVFGKIDKVSFDDKFIKQYLDFPQKNLVAFNSMRYLFMERKKQKYIEFFNTFSKEIVKNDFYFDDCLSLNPFKNKVSPEKILAGIRGKKKIYMFGYLKSKYKLYYIKNWIIKCAKTINKGNSIVFIGADGVGKTTIINLLHQITNSRSFYMGTNEFIFDKLFKKLDTNKIFFKKILKFFLLYAENWIKWAKVSFHTFLGRTVLLDRHPSYQYFLQKKPGYYLSKVFYQFLFPKPDKIIILYADSSLVLQRKNEHSCEVIESIYKSFKNHLMRQKNVYWIENMDINDTLGSSIKVINKKNK